jgi:hypothetical protein
MYFAIFKAEPNFNKPEYSEASQGRMIIVIVTGEAIVHCHLICIYFLFSLFLSLSLSLSPSLFLSPLGSW